MGLIALYVLAYTGVWIALQGPTVVALPLRIDQLAPAQAAQHLSLALGVGSLVAFGSPLFGRLSDRTTSRFGRRRPWLLGGALVSVVGALVLAVAPSLLLLTVGWCLVKLGCGIAFAVLLAVLADLAAAGRRGTIAGLLGICNPIGAAVAASLVSAFERSTALMFLAPACVAAATAVAFAIVMPDEPPAHRGERRPLWSGLVVDVRKHPDFGWTWLSRFLFFLSVGCVMSYQVLYLRHELDRPRSEIPELIAFATLLKTIAIVGASLLVGRLSDAVGRRKPFVIAAALLFAVGPIVIVLTGTYAGLVVGMVIVGVAVGTYAAIDLALAIDVLPDRDTDAAKDLGVISLASMLPGSVVPALAPLLLLLGGGSYAPLFLAGACFALLAACALRPIRGVR